MGAKHTGPADPAAAVAVVSTCPYARKGVPRPQVHVSIMHGPLFSRPGPSRNERQTLFGPSGNIFLCAVFFFEAADPLEPRGLRVMGSTTRRPVVNPARDRPVSKGLLTLAANDVLPIMSCNPGPTHCWPSIGTWLAHTAGVVRDSHETTGLVTATNRCPSPCLACTASSTLSDRHASTTTSQQWIRSSQRFEKNRLRPLLLPQPQSSASSAAQRSALGPSPYFQINFQQESFSDGTRFQLPVALRPCTLPLCGIHLGPIVLS